MELVTGVYSANDNIKLRRVGRISDEIVRVLRRKILVGELPVGRTTLSDLSNMLGVSATPIREALVSLENEGFVERAPNQSVKIVALTTDDLKDIYHAQAYLAGMLTRRACVNRSDALIGLLSNQLREMETIRDKDIDSKDKLEQLNWNFHKAINVAAQSPKVLKVLSVSVRYIPEGFYSLLDGWTTHSEEGHREIVNALTVGDESKAQEAAIKHVVDAGELLVAYFREMRS